MKVLCTYNRKRCQAPARISREAEAFRRATSRYPALGPGRMPVAGRQGGFSIIELMMVLVVMGVLLGVGAPAFTNLILDNRSVSAIYDLRGALSTARSEALAQRAFVTFCPSNTGAACGGTWEEGYIAFVDFDGDATIDAGGGAATDDFVLLAELRDINGLTISLASDSGNQRLRFDPDGTALNNAGTFTVCDRRGAADARALFLSNSGQARSLTDSDANGIPNMPATQGGADVACP